ncbi:MAG: hypothetical protein ACOZBW_08345 [Thermodesulfobacteriota bacterium]
MPAIRAHRFFFIIIVLVLLAVAGILVYRYVPVRELMAAINEQTPPWLFVCLMALLPLAGVPLSIFFLLICVVFSTGTGVLITAAVIPFHLAGFFLLTKVIRSPIERFLARKNYPLPEIPAHRYASFCFLINILPIPYVVKNYLLPLAGLPFSFFFWISWPVQFVMALPWVLIGSAWVTLVKEGLTQKDPAVLVILAAAMALFAVIYWIVRRFEKRYGDALPGRENGRMPS